MKQKLLFFIITLVFSFSSFSQTSIINQDLDCITGCSDLTINFTESSDTSDYTVESIEFNPPSNPLGFQNQIFLNTDDLWSDVVNIPFSFNFFSTNYNEFVIGANGVISFDTSNAGTGNGWSFTETLPNSTNPTLSEANIFGAAHDMDPAASNGTHEIGYEIKGEAPFRYFIIGYYNVAHFACNDIKTTQMIVLYETTNIIDVYLFEKPICTTWNVGNAVVGIQNPEGTIAAVPPGRNTGQWTATNEAWRFNPINTTDNTFAWYDQSGLLISNDVSINVCPTDVEVYTAEVTYIDPSTGSPAMVSESITLTPALIGEDPSDFEVCSDSDFAVFDLTVQTNVITGGSTCSIINYYESLTDAENNTNPITQPEFYTNISNPQTIYVRVENSESGSYETTQFGLFVNNSTENCSDIGVYLFSYIPPRPGLIGRNTLIIKNLGSFVVSGSVEFTHDSLLTLEDVLGVDPGNSITPTATGFILNFNNLLPDNNEVVTVRLNMSVSAEAGDLVTSSVVYSVSDIDLENNESYLTEVVVNSYDPNNKIESHGPKIEVVEFTNEDYLYYTINFQNLGTAEAIDVRVEDVLDVQLDVSTFKMLAASHDFVLTQVDQNLTWEFDDINLPSESMDEPNSHGYIYFRIKPLTGYGEGDIIPNTADIFFDFNPAVTTNTFETEFIAALSVDEFTSTQFIMYPNPANSTVNVQFNSIISETINVSVFDIQGKLVLGVNKEIRENQMQIDISGLSQGMYFVQLKGDTFKMVEKLIVE